MEYTDKILAALNAVGQDYIRVPALHEDAGVLRERVFCYEFYHQLRKLLRTKKVVVHGELDKVGYPIFGSEKPDFLIHKPKSNSSNAVVVEVKVTLTAGPIGEDLNKLLRFVNNYFYESAYLIIVGFDENRVLNELESVFLSYSNYAGDDKVAILLLPRSGECSLHKYLNVI